MGETREMCRAPTYGFRSSPRHRGRSSVLDPDPPVSVDADEVEDPSHRWPRAADHHAAAYLAGEDEDRPDPGRVEEGQLREVEDQLALRFERAIHRGLERLEGCEIELARE